METLTTLAFLITAALLSPVALTTLGILYLETFDKPVPR